MCLLILQPGIRWTQSYSPWCLWAPAYLPGQGKSQTLQASPMEQHRTHMTCKAAGLKRKPGGTKSTTLISSLKCIGQMHFSHTFLSWRVEHKVTPFYESKRKTGINTSTVLCKCGWRLVSAFS